MRLGALLFSLGDSSVSRRVPFMLNSSKGPHGDPGRRQTRLEMRANRRFFTGGCGEAASTHVILDMSRSWTAACKLEWRELPQEVQVERIPLAGGPV